LSSDLAVDLELEPFWVAGPDTQFVVGRKGQPDRRLDFDPSSIALFRGHVRGRAGSHVYLALSDRQSMGFVDLGPGAQRYEISSKGRFGTTLAPQEIVVYKQTAATSLPPNVPLCGVEGPHLKRLRALDTGTVAATKAADSTAAAGPAPSTVGLKHMELAVETDYEYFILFGDETEATTYLILMYGAVSDIYMRDVDMRIELVFTRIWTDPDDLFNGPDPLFEFYPYWEANMGAVQRDAAQLFSGRRNYPFGGQAFLSQLCEFAYGIVGYAVGFFPDPSKPSPFNYDVPVTAHELGHNSGTLHTHDYDLDTCDDASTTPRRGPIMSYCGQTWSGMNANSDNYFHTFPRQEMRAHINVSACIVADCNMNNVIDSADISGGTSDDTNFNGIPDECEDCNGNGTLDPADIAGASEDKNFNGIPDECEPDCNDNGVPDDKDIADGTSLDLFGNGIPDECEEDCNGNGTSDYTEIQANMPLDVDRNAVLDACQDCDGDGTTDLDALESSHNLWIASGLPGSIIREFYATTGVLTRSSGGGAPGLVNQGQDLIVVAGGHALVTSAGDSRVKKFDANGNYLGNFVSSGSGGLSYPTGLIMTSGGTLLVSSRDTDSVLSYDGTTGASTGAFVSAGSGGLTGPFGLTLGPNGNLFVTSATNEVLEFDKADGSFVGKLVDAENNGTLDRPRGLAFKADGNLLVASYGTDEVLEFDGKTGAPLGKWAQVGTATRITQDSPWGIRVGPNGHVFVSRTGTDYSSGNPSAEGGVQESHLTDARMFEYDVCTGLFRKTHIGGNDHGLFFATGFDFVPGWTLDCNNNQIPDSCDISSSSSVDADSNGTPDECEFDCNNNGRRDQLDLIPFGTSYDCNCNFTPDECDVSTGISEDCDANGVPDECEDCNANGVGDACDIRDATSDDCNLNGTPDECEPDTDCNGNGEADICDLANGTSRDCNDNRIPDTCDAEGGGLVFNVDFESGLPGGWTTTGIFQVTSACAVNPVCDGSAWAYAGSTFSCSYGDNQVGKLISPSISLAPTVATLSYCSMVDTEAGYDFVQVIVNGDVVASESGAIGVWNEWVVDLTPYAGQVITITWRLASDSFVSGTRGWQVDNIRLVSGSEDCDGNSVPDECDPDCDDDGIPDGCDNPADCVCIPCSTPVTPTVLDEVLSGAAASTAMVGASVKNRFISVTGGDPGRSQAIRVTVENLPPPYDAWNGLHLWVDGIREICENAGQGALTDPEDCDPAPGLQKNTFHTATLTCQPGDALFMDWTALDLPVHIFNKTIIPSSGTKDAVYLVQLVDETCSLTDENSYSDPPLTVVQPRWGDVVLNCATNPCPPPEGVVNVTTDVTSILDKFRNLPGAPIKARCDLVGIPPTEAELDMVISILDVTACLAAFVGGDYFFPLQRNPCPQ
jgi:hypothetical protein